MEHSLYEAISKLKIIEHLRYNILDPSLFKLHYGCCQIKKNEPLLIKS